MCGEKEWTVWMGHHLMDEEQEDDCRLTDALLRSMAV